MVEATDLNLLTYVIKFQSGRYFMDRPSEKIDWSSPYSTENLVEANIYNDPAEAQYVCKQFPTTATVHPVSKKVFFEAALKGERQ